MMRDSWRRVLGLASRALLISLQRFLDVILVLQLILHPKYGSSWTPWLLLSGLTVTTALMAFTMQRHWSALNRGRPHGTLVGVLAATLQVAPLIEMLDKVFFSRRPRDRGRGFSISPLEGSSEGHRDPLLQNESPQTRSPHAPRSDLPKGSPGENIMRGVRKMSMVNLPQAMLSLWVHASELVPIGVAPPQGVWQLGLAFVAAFLCTAFGIADFVLYIWVHDAFVRQNKKLVTLHYCAEILCRVPAVVLFHVSYSRMHNYVPTLILFLSDVLLTSLLLLMSRLVRPTTVVDAARCCLSRFSRQSLTQFLYSLVVSVQLFVVNVVFFDPGLMFCYVNQAFYIIKYVQLAIMLVLIRRSRGSGVLDGFPRARLDAFCWGEVAAAAVNAAIVWIYVPIRRRQKDDRLTSGTSPPPGPPSLEEGRVNVDASTTSPRLHAGGRALEHLEEIFEMLLLLGKASCPRNRARILDLIASELWLQALCWDGDYDDSKGATMSLSLLHPSRAIARIKRSDSPAEAAAFLHGPHISLQEASGGSSGSKAWPCYRGRFDGRRIVWEDGSPPWTRTKCDSVGSHQSAEVQVVIHLILPQLALALKWDVLSPHSPHHGPQAVGSITEGECGPLLSFLMQYALMTQQADYITELYWALFCLSHEEAAVTEKQKLDKQEEAPLRPYRDARLALLNALCGARGADQPDSPSARQDRFLRTARELLQSQKELWRQKMQLLVYLGQLTGPQCAAFGGSGSLAVPGLGPSGSGAWAHRTQDLRNALFRWSDIQKSLRNAWKPDEDEHLLMPFNSAAASVPGYRSVDLLHEGSSLASLPIDPALAFRGIIPEECAVMPSNHAPILFCCNMGPAIPACGSSKSTTEGSQSRRREKYLLKVGDDLRQDQLMLQIMDLMCCVWQDRLPAADTRLLQLAKFRVLAVTPRSGYVKFVPDAVPLSEALHQSQGDLVAWFERNKPDDITMDRILDNLCGSVAASCVVTYVLGIGDRHLENLCITRRGQFFHIDFSFVLGDDPKPCAPAARLPQQVAHALLATDRLLPCFGLAARAYVALRPFAGLWSSILQLTAAAGGSGCKKLRRDATAAISGLRERLRVHEADDELAASEFLCLVRESSEGLASILMDKVHAAGLFWR